MARDWKQKLRVIEVLERIADLLELIALNAGVAVGDIPTRADTPPDDN